MEALDGRFAAKQSQGDREYQEDDFGFLELPDAVLLVLADGMGGHVGGHMASTTAVKTLVDRLQNDGDDVISNLQSAVYSANEALRAAITDDGELSGMGTTLVGALVTEAGLYWVSVGDSPLWLLRDGELYRLNEDHSMAPVLADLVATGRMSAEEAATDKRRNSLRSAVMGDDLPLVDTGGPLGLARGDRILLASDGLETLSHVKIRDVAQKNLTHGTAATAMALMAAVEWVEKPNQDNTTIMIYEVAQDCGTIDLSGLTPIADDHQDRVESAGIMSRIKTWIRGEKT